MSRGKTAIAGLVLAVVSALAVMFGDALGLDLDATIFVGAACGAILGLVADRGPFARLGGFLIGFVLTFAAYGLRAAILPDSASGRAVAIFLLLILVMAVSALSGGRLPLWSFMVGIAAAAGTYETTFTISPADFLAQAPTAAVNGLLATSIGFAATVWFGTPDDDGSPGEPELVSAQSASLDSLMNPKSEA
jgi:hypothetical protein